MSLYDSSGMQLTFSNFCLASLMTFISSSFLVFEKDLEYDEFLLSVLCFALILRRSTKNVPFEVAMILKWRKVTHFFRLFPI